MELQDDETVSIGGRFYRFGEVAPYLDAEILYEAQGWAGYGATMQAVVDAYLELYARRRAGVSPDA
jgi:hypothetical protein